MLVSLSLILALAVSHFIMGLFVYLKDPSDKTNRYFFAFVVSIVGWLMTNYFSNSPYLPHETLLALNKAIFVFPALCAYFVLMFSLLFTGTFQTVRRSIRLAALAVTGLVVLASGSNLVVHTIVAGQNGVYGIIFGPAAPLYFVYMVVYFGLVLPIFLIAARRTKTPEKRARFQFIVSGILTSFILVVITNFFIPAVFRNYQLTMAGPYATLILISSLTYAIVKHRLFQLRLAVARSVAFFLLLATFGLIYGGILFSVSQAFFAGQPVSNGQEIVSVGLAFVMAITFQPLRNFFEEGTDRIFYRDRYDSQVVLNNFSGILVSELDLDRILKRTITDICTQLHIQFGQLVVFNHDRVYRIEHHGPLPKRLMIVPELRRLNRALIVADELPEGERKALLEDHGVRVSLMLSTREEFIGYLLLGDKLSGDIYSTQDLELLEIISKQLAVAILNAKAYAEIQEFNRTLQERVDHATNRLRVANRHLKELDKAKDEFISMASHQLRTPLTTIKGYLSMMLEGDAGRMTKAQTEFAGFAFGSSERMVNLISDLLNVSRLSAGRFIIQTKPTDMVAMIQDEVRQLQSHAAAKNLQLVFEPPAKPLPLAEIDDNKTRQVVMNFIDNALYYTPSGSVTVHLDQTGQYVRLRVTDTGIGVPDEAKRKLFSKFFRAGNAQSVRPDGTGLGLYLARRVVEDQGGTIIFESALGKGSTFGFELPLRPASKTKKEDTHAKH